MSYSSASIALHGPTLTLRPPTADDAPALLELASDAEVTRWFSWGPYTALAQPLAYIERCAHHRATGEQLDLLIVHRELGPAGIIGLSEFSRRDRRAVVGTWFGRRFWGTGANREAKAIVFRLGFDVLRLNRIGSYSNPENTRSTRALLGVGLRHEGVLRAWHRHGGRYLDVNVFALLRDEWAAAELAGVDVAVEGDIPPAFARG
jgi:[ribosomal protein S5]-alanine N-acetyltransferase